MMNRVQNRRNYIIPRYCNVYNASLVNQGFQMGNSYNIPQIIETPDFLDSNYMFDELVDVTDENRNHSIQLIRSMMQKILE
jgi:hypothetical protein